MCEQYLTNPLRPAVEFLKWYELFTTAIIGDILKNNVLNIHRKWMCALLKTLNYIFLKNGKNLMGKLCLPGYGNFFFW